MAPDVGSWSTFAGNEWNDTLRFKAALHTSIVAAGLLVACGGSDDLGPGDDGDGGATETESTPTSTAEADAPSTDVSVGTLVLDGETYHFSVDEAPRCNPDYISGLGFRASLVRVDKNGTPIAVPGNSSGLTQSLLVTLAREEGGGEGSVLAQLDVGWQSGLDMTAPLEEFTMDGNHAEGRGTFVSSDSDGPVAGSFEVTCAE